MQRNEIAVTQGCVIDYVRGRNELAERKTGAGGLGMVDQVAQWADSAAPAINVRTDAAVEGQTKPIPSQTPTHQHTD